MKVHEPFQMLGLLDEDLKQALGIDVEGVFRRKTMFGFENKDWKPWTFNGLEVLVPGQFNTTVDEKGDTLIYPEGDLTAEPSGRMPRGFHFFDAIIRQKHLDPDHLNVEDNLEEFKPLADADLAAIKADVDAARATGRAVIANFGGMALGRHRAGARAVPQGPAGHPRRQRVVHVARRAGGTTSTASSSGRPRSPSRTWSGSTRRSATRWTSSSSAGPTSARRPRRSARCRRSASSGCPTTSGCATGFTPTRPGSASSTRAAR